ncbi:MAG: copper resistance protein CopC [Actinomycetota bacterium]
MKPRILLWPLRALAVGLAAFGLLVGLGRPASAHAYLVSTSPPAGARLGTAPGVVILRFSEAVQPNLSAATVTTPDGGRVSGTVSGESMSVTLVTNSPGAYRVTWKAVSADDGHTTRGSFQFSVATTSGPSAATGGGTPPWQNVLFAAGRTIEYAGLLLAAGLLVLGGAAGRGSGLPWARAAIRTRLRVALLAAFLATFIVVLGEAGAAEGSLSVGSLASFLSNGVPGGARLALLCFEGLALASVTASSWMLTGTLLSVALVGAAAASHAAAVHPIALGIAVDAIHLIAAALWAGGIFALVTLHPPGGWRGVEGRALLQRFTPIALTGFTVSVLFGAIQGLQEVRGVVSRLFTTSYGLVLMVKVAAILAMVPLSWLAWRRRAFRRAEALIAVVVVAVAGALSVLPVPAAPVRATAHFPSGLPAPGDLTLGDHAGQFLVGLTIRSAVPGPNDVLLYVKPVEGRAAGVPVDLTVNGRTVLTTECGPTCRRTNLTLRGGEPVLVSVGGSKGGEAGFTIPQLPAPSGVAVLRDVNDRMHALRTYRLAETLSSGLGTTVSADYTFQAPDRMAIDTPHEDADTVWIGGTRYSKEPGKPWQVERGGPRQRVPSFIWDYFHPQIDAHLVGTAKVDGVKTRILAFFADQSGTAIWFRLWVDAGGVVHRAHMRAFGHFMDHRYYDFDQPVSIKPPKGAGG